MATPKSWACAQNHAAELLKKPEELGLRTEPRSRAAQETRTGVEGETTQGRPTELLTKPRRPREARKPQSSRWTCHNMHIHAKYKYCIGLHCIALHCIVLHCIAWYWIAMHCIAFSCIVLPCIVLHSIAWNGSISTLYTGKIKPASTGGTTANFQISIFVIFWGHAALGFSHCFP